MRNVLKWLGIVLGGLIGLVLIAALAAFVLGTRRLSASQPLPGEDFTVAAGDAAVARGEYLLTGVAGCLECHGANLGGTEFINEAPIGLVWAPNLTTGQGGVGATYSDADWERALRHGVRPNGQNLIIMPSHQYTHMSDADLSAVLAYMRTFPPVDQVVPERRIDPLGVILVGAGMFGELPAEAIDHDRAHAAVVEPAVSAAYGEYLVALATCRDCHGPQLDGVVAGGPPSEVPPPNITGAGALANYSEGDFIETIRTGVTPDGRTLSAEMPWGLYRNMEDADLAAMFTYLKGLPAGQ